MYLSPNNFKPPLPGMTNTGSLFIKGHSGDSIPLFARLEERGFTFVEVLVAIVVLALLFIPISMIFTSSLAGMARACRRTAASNLCRDKMERVKACGCSFYLENMGDSPGGIYLEIEDPVIDNPCFLRRTVIRSSDMQIEGEELELPLLKISVLVKWTEAGAERTVEMESLLAKR